MKHLEIEVTLEEKNIIDAVLLENSDTKKNSIYRDSLMKGKFTVYDILEKKEETPICIGVDLEDEEKEELERVYKTFSSAVKKKYFFRKKLVDGFKKRSK